MHENVLDREWDVLSLLRFVAPTIAMMLLMGLYTLVDTVFAARFINTDALSAINIVCPVNYLSVGLGTMLAAGGNAVVSREMGAGNEREAKEDFTLIVIAGAVIGFLMLAAGMLWCRQLIEVLGAGELLFLYCKDYLETLLLFIPANILQTIFSNLFVTAGKPGLGFGLSVLAGLANIVLDYVFIVIFDLGIRGAALGTGCGCLIPAVTGIVFFARSRGVLSFVRPRKRWRILKESCFNGSSEMVGQMASAVTTFLFNRTMMRLLGEDGVAAITILIYAQFLLNTLLLGFSMGAAPIIGFFHGSRNGVQQRKLFRLCMGFVAAASLLVFAVSKLGGPYIVQLFAPYPSRVYQIAVNGFSIFSYSFLFCGFNIFTSAMFTALSNGKVSAALSFFRTFVLLSGGILLLPQFWGITGVWLAVPIAEGIMLFAAVFCLIHYRKRDSYEML